MPQVSCGSEDETKLVARAKAGDDDAFTRLVRAHEVLALRVAESFAGDASAAEDATQEAFIKAFRALDRFRSGAPFRPWLLAIVANEARSRRRAENRHLARAARLAAEAAGFTPVPSAEASLVGAESRGSVIAALKNLPRGHRDVVVCRFYLGLSEEETAAALQICAGTAKSRLSRALSRLRGQLHDEFQRAA
jgi:RNA polymerase sigma factor (sigma-70 family)